MGRPFSDSHQRLLLQTGMAPSVPAAGQVGLRTTRNVHPLVFLSAPAAV